MTFYEEVGGETFFADLISQFYAHVATDPILRPMYPDSDMKGAAERLQMFLEQYWGGPSTYSEERGHPRLRMRHAPYAIDDGMRDRWMTHMTKALQVCVSSPEIVAEMHDYFVRAADHMRNV